MLAKARKTGLQIFWSSRLQERAIRCQKAPKYPERTELSHDSPGNRPVSKAGGAECGPLEVEIPLDAELVELILSWQALSKEVQQQIMLLVG